MPNIRGLSTAAKKAKAYLKKHPETEGPTLAKKFGINLSTVYRSDWWKTRGEDSATVDKNK